MMRGDGKGVGWPGPWPSTVPITWANLGVGDEDVLQAGVASRDHISIFAKLCWLLRKHGRRGDDDQGNHSCSFLSAASHRQSSERFHQFDPLLLSRDHLRPGLLKIMLAPTKTWEEG